MRRKRAATHERAAQAALSFYVAQGAARRCGIASVPVIGIRDSVIRSGPELVGYLPNRCGCPRRAASTQSRSAAFLEALEGMRKRRKLTHPLTHTQT